MIYINLRDTLSLLILKIIIFNWQQLFHQPGNAKKTDKEGIIFLFPLLLSICSQAFSSLLVARATFLKLRVRVHSSCDWYVNFLVAESERG